MSRATLTILLCLLISACTARQFTPEPSVVFKGGTEECFTYRIPALVKSNAGTLLAFAEARRNGKGDSGDIDLVVKRSTDGGISWSGDIIVWDDGDNTCGSPVPVVLEDTGRILLLSIWKNSHSDKRYDFRGYIQHSDDDGLSWSEPRDITDSFADPEWYMYAFGPGHAIELQNNDEHRGRIVVPCYSKWWTEGRVTGHSFVIVSDDGGESWSAGGYATLGNECMATELSDGSIILNMREFWVDGDPAYLAKRITATSIDGGGSFGPCRYVDDLDEPVCQGSILSFRKNNRGKDLLLFMNPDSQKTRTNLTVKLSGDYGDSWSAVYKAPFTKGAYSDMTLMEDNTVALIYEAGEETYRDAIYFDKIKF